MLRERYFPTCGRTDYWLNLFYIATLIKTPYLLVDKKHRVELLFSSFLSGRQDREY